MKKDRLKLILTATAIVAAISLVNKYTGNNDAQKPSITQIDERIRNDAAMAALDQLKLVLRDPASLSVIAVGTDKNGHIVCMKYRAKNGFGGTSISYMVSVHGVLYRKTDVYNKYCSQDLYDETKAKNAIK